MKIAIHQPHYFPWEGYLRKIKSVDKFILMDDVQLTDSSPMYRHSLLTIKGDAKYITIPFEKEHYKSIPYKDIRVNNCVDWQRRHINFIKENYGKSPYYTEVMENIKDIFQKKYDYLCDVTTDTILIMIEMLDIKTELVKMSSLNYPKESKKNQLVLDLCIAAGADYYLSGRGARKYMELTPYSENGITVEFQDFVQEPYPQHPTNHFVGGLSILDMLLSIGIKETKNRFV